MKRGTVKFFNSEKGFGFIRADDDSPDVFVHISQLRASGLNDLADGQSVEFDIGEFKGRQQAQNIVVLPEKNPQTSKLVLQAQARSATLGHNKATLEAWDNVLDFIRGKGDRVVYMTGAWGSARPQFEGEWAKFNAWCKLVGLKPIWKQGTGSLEGRQFLWDWTLEVEPQALPSEQLARKMIEEYGTPPGY